MGLMDKVRGQFIDIIEFLDDSRDTIVWRFPRQGNEIKNNAKLVVREGQVAVFESEGKIADVFTAGTYTLETKNMPILSDLKGWKYDFNSPFKAEVYFFGTRLYTDMKWGTQNPIPMTDPQFGMVQLRAFGSYAMQVSDPSKLLRQLVGTDGQFETGEVEEFLRSNIVSKVGVALASSGIPMMQMSAKTPELSAALTTTLTADFADMGVAIPKFNIESITMPQEVMDTMNKMSQMGMINAAANMDQFAKFQAAQAIETAAANPGGGAVGVGVGLAMGQQIANAMAPSVGGAAAPAAPASSAAGGAPPPLPGAAQPWFIAVGGQQVGPIAAQDLAARVASGDLTPTTLAWQEGMGAWTAASEIDALRGLFTPAPPPLPPTDVPPAPPAAPTA
ncbi:MAG TPA: SPFH domain-containing protein [Marmoricola sp.]|jgi:membrane protease subunit (stomatin/prohibitin family)|nr:SPFH domain-containing protein [Marmoricola sp.]